MKYCDRLLVLMGNRRLYCIWTLLFGMMLCDWLKSVGIELRKPDSINDLQSKLLFLIRPADIPGKLENSCMQKPFLKLEREVYNLQVKFRLRTIDQRLIYLSLSL